MVQNPAPFFPLNISAVMDDQSVTVSGHPDALDAFSLTVPSGVTVHRPVLGTLYHSPIHIGSAQSQVLADIKRRQIRFPDFKDIKFPIRSSFTGRLIDDKVQSGSLVESVVDMILTQPVNWDVVAGELTKAIPSGTPARFLNIGPGAGLFRSMERSFPKGLVSFVDLSLDNSNSQEGDFVAKQVPIAIVGMAVNMPGAPNTDALWKILEEGINTISEVRLIEKI
jgi:acyl transferase domain-containing protein